MLREFMEIKPFMPTADVWSRKAFSERHMAAYREAAEDGLISIRKVTYNRTMEMVVIEYLTSIPVEWVHEDLKNRTRPPRTVQLAFKG